MVMKRIVAFPHVSNLLGEVLDVKTVTETVRKAAPRAVSGSSSSSSSSSSNHLLITLLLSLINQMVCVDGVAYAPHDVIDVKDWDVDW